MGMSYGGLGLNLPCLLHVLWWVFLNINHFIYTEEYRTEIYGKGPNVEVSKKSKSKDICKEKRVFNCSIYSFYNAHMCQNIRLRMPYNSM